MPLGWPLDPGSLLYSHRNHLFLFPFIVDLMEEQGIKVRGGSGQTIRGREINRGLQLYLEFAINCYVVFSLISIVSV